MMVMILQRLPKSLITFYSSKITNYMDSVKHVNRFILYVYSSRIIHPSLRTVHHVVLPGVGSLDLHDTTWFSFCDIQKNQRVTHNRKHLNAPLCGIRGEGSGRIARRVRRRRRVGRRSLVRPRRHGQLVDAPLQHLEHSAHRRPARGDGLYAPEPNERHLPRDLLAAEAVLHHQHAVLDHVVVHPEREEDVVGVLGVRPGVAPPTADHLQQQHPVAVHVGLDGDDAEPAGEHLRRDEPDGAARVRHGQDALLGVAQLRHPEVGDLGPEVHVQEHVVRLDVEVDDPGVAALVQVLQPPRDAHGDLLQRLPPQRRRIDPAGGGGRLLLIGVDVLVQRAAGHVLVDQRAARALEAEPEQSDHVHVGGPADADHLVQELLGAVGPGVVQDLDGDRPVAVVAVQDAAEHGAVAALAEFVLKRSGYGLHLRVPVPFRSEGPVLLQHLFNVCSVDAASSPPVHDAEYLSTELEDDYKECQ
jgi:hypothetical protein